jgi:hypothetical protein
MLAQKIIIILIFNAKLIYSGQKSFERGLLLGVAITRSLCDIPITVGYVLNLCKSFDKQYARLKIRINIHQ